MLINSQIILLSASMARILNGDSTETELRFEGDSKETPRRLNEDSMKTRRRLQEDSTET